MNKIMKEIIETTRLYRIQQIKRAINNGHFKPIPNDRPLTPQDARRLVESALER